MLRLTTFGGLAVTQDSKPVVGAAAGPRRLVILTLLAEAKDRGFDRDVLAALLWPDSEPEQARHSLHQALYAMRRAHGDELIIGTRMLHLNPSLVSTDIWEFETAIGRRQFADAVAMYRGPFADGFVFSEGGDVDHRLDALRSRFARAHAAAVEALASDAAKRGDHAGRVRWWQILSDADPLSVRATAELVDALITAGERAQALKVASRHEALVRAELGTAADPEIVKRLLKLRASPSNAGDDRQRPASTIAGGQAVPLSSITANETIAKEERRRAVVGRVLGSRYRVEKLIEEGSLTATYAATASRGHRVEVHVVHPHVAAVTSVARFTDVFGRVASLGDAGIHPVIEFEVASDAMLFVTAERSPLSLRERLRQERELPVRDALTIAREVAIALAHAHATGVRHGDLRPKHIALGPSGVRVASFGVVEALSPGAEWRATSTVITFGSPAYLSPEQLMGDVQTDARSDVYAFGCIVYEMLAGEPPFGRPSRGSGLGRKLTQSPPRLQSLRESVPTELDSIVHTCLSRLPADRYASGESLCEALAGANLS